MAFDPHLSRDVPKKPLEDGLPAVKGLGRAILAGRVRHGGRPVLR